MSESRHTRVRTQPKYLLWLILLLAIGIRAALFVEFNATPLIQLDRWSQTDMHYYDDWARRISGGDWLSRRLPLPLHEWHVEIADTYFANHPQTSQSEIEAARLANGAPEARVWARWMKAPQFYQDAMYPYLVAMTYAVFGQDAKWVFAWQLLLGVFTLLLIWDLTSRHFGVAAGYTAAAIALLARPLVYYEFLLLRESAIVFASLAVTWLADRAIARNRPIGYWLVGLALGLCCLLKSSLLLMAGGIGVGLFVAHQGHPKIAAKAMAVVLAGLAVGTTPLIVRNLAVGVPALALASGGPLTFVAANESTTRPDEGNYVNTTVLARFLGDTNGGWTDAFSTAFAGHSVASYAALLWEKWRLAWHWYEIPNNDNMYYTARMVPFLRWLPVTFGAIAPFAIVGLVIGLSRWRQSWMLYQLVLAALAPLVIFYVLGRFRVALVAASIPFAALAIVKIVNWFLARNIPRAALATAAVALVALWTSQPLTPGQQLIRTDDWLMPFLVQDQPLLEQAVARKDWAGGAAAYEDFFQHAEPTETDIERSHDPDLGPRLAELHEICARLWHQAGDDRRAEAEMTRAQQLKQIRVAG